MINMFYIYLIKTKPVLIAAFNPLFSERLISRKPYLYPKFVQLILCFYHLITHIQI